MDIDWGTVVIGFVCTCIGLWAGWGIYRGKVEALKLEIKALKRELSDEKARSEAYGKAADEWRGAAMRADAEVKRLKHEKTLVQKALAHRTLEDGENMAGWSPDYWRQVLEACEAERGDIEYQWEKAFQGFRADVDLGGKHVGQ